MSLINMIRERRRRWATKRTANAKSKVARPRAKSAAQKRRVGGTAARPTNAQREVKPTTPETIARLCADAGYPQLAERLIKDKTQEAVVRSVLKNAGEITKAVQLARIIHPEIDPSIADGFIDVKASAAHAKRSLIDKIVDNQSPDIANMLPADSRYAEDAHDHGWNDVVADYNAKQNARSESEPESAS